MRKEMLAEDFMNASKAYTDLQGAMMEMFDNDPIMSCLLGSLNRLANDYHTAILKIYRAGLTLDEAMKLNERSE